MTRTAHPIETLTDREREVLRLVAEGRTNPQVAEVLGIRFETAKWYVSEVISKLGVASREEAAAEWRRYHQPSARLRRSFASLAGARPWKLAVAATAVGTVAVVATVVIAGQGVLPTSDEFAAPEPLVALLGRGPTSLAMPADEAIDVASEQLGFQVLRPASLPTSANQLVTVEYDLGPEGLPNATRMSRLAYQSLETRVVSGATVPAAALEVWQVPGVSPGGEPAGIDVRGFKVWKQTIPPADAALAADPRNTHMVYYALGEEWSFVLDFRGEEPSADGLREMLLSFQ
jgi:DNA-binding CsgD family transcriptional regulator